MLNLALQHVGMIKISPSQIPTTHYLGKTDDGVFIPFSKTSKFHINYNPVIQ